MRTEAEIIYTIHDIVRAGEANADDPINERLMRQFLSIHRGRTLSQAYKKGAHLPDEIFQAIGILPFTFLNGAWTSSTIPKLIKFDSGRFGIMINKDGYVISVLNSEEFINAKNHKYNKLQPRLLLLNNKFNLDLGMEQECDNGLDDHTYSNLNTTVRKLKSEAATGTINLFAQAVLVNPDDEPGYDFTSSPYPMPDELIENLINSVNAREFNLFLRMKSDETGDNRHNIAEQHTREEL